MESSAVPRIAMQAAPRSYRWIYVALAVVGLALDLGTKYGMFRWLYNGGVPADRGAFRAFANEFGVVHGEYDLLPGWFKFTAEFDPGTPPCDCAVRNPLQTWSAPVMPHVNHGALFGIGKQHKGLANGVFAAVCGFAAIGIAVWVLRGAARHDRWLCVALGLVTAGTLGNFYDRLVFGGVRDFLHFYWFEFPVFNVADCGLVVGAGLLLLQAMLSPDPKKDAPAAPPPGPPDAAAR
jgi:signal peptidase II